MTGSRNSNRRNWFNARASHPKRLTPSSTRWDAAYESLLKSRRQILHQRIAEALRERFPTEAESEPEIVAQHFTWGGLTEAAVGYWLKAAVRSRETAAAALVRSAHCAASKDSPAKRDRKSTRLNSSHSSPSRMPSSA